MTIRKARTVIENRFGPVLDMWIDDGDNYVVVFKVDADAAHIHSGETLDFIALDGRQATKKILFEMQEKNSRAG